MATFLGLRFFRYFSYSFCFFLEDFAMPLVIHGLKEFRAFTVIFILGKYQGIHYKPDLGR